MNNKINDGGPAFPRPMSSLSSEEWSTDQEGISLRDYFAAKAMQGCLRADLRLENNTISGLAEMSYTIANAMLKAKEK